MRAYCLDGYLEKKSPHYLFFCRPCSIAEKEIDHIISVQERSYDKIVRLLGVAPDFPLRYILCDTSEEVGRIYGDNEPCNGFADSPDTVFAVYSDTVKCIGPHEDTHLIACLIARPDSNFVREGLAMYTDEVWWGKANTSWAADFIRSGKYISVDKLFDNTGFFAWPDEITYPIAGAFTMWLVQRMGMDEYLRSVYVQGNQSKQGIERYFGMPLCDVDTRFQQWLLDHN